MRRFAIGHINVLIRSEVRKYSLEYTSSRTIWSDNTYDRIMKYYLKDDGKPFRVSVEGNIGCGKSTLMNYLGNFPEVDTYSEPIDKWRNVGGHNLLDLLYKDLKRWNLTFSHYVQLSRLNMQSMETSKTVQIFERSLQNNRNVFVEMAYQDGLLEDVEYTVLCKWYDWMIKNMDIKLDLIVYLRSSPEVVFERIKRRNRPEESGLTLEYLQHVHNYHEKWLIEPKTQPVPVLQINVNHELAKVKELYQVNEPYILGQVQLI